MAQWRYEVIKDNEVVSIKQINEITLIDDVNNDSNLIFNIFVGLYVRISRAI